MNWAESQENLRKWLGPEVGCFVDQILRELELQNVFDAPSVIGMVVQRMQVADSDVIRAAVAETEHALKVTLKPIREVARRLGA